MRKTLTIDDDVAAMLRQLNKARDQTLTKALNEVMRVDLNKIEPEAEAEKTFPRRRKVKSHGKRYDAGERL